jgi:two-component system, cell cycle sensor histidine kinase and response regulator CckA
MREVLLVVMTLAVLPVVLVVDDDPGQVAIVTSVLRKSGFRVLSASSGLDALDIAGRSDERIYLLVTDLNMPNMSGLALAAKLIIKEPELKVLYLTADANELFRQAHVLKSHEAFLEKPVSAHGLREAVYFLLRQALPTSFPEKTT